MPYRRLPNTDKSRLKALSTLLENNDFTCYRKTNPILVMLLCGVVGLLVF